MEQEDCLRGSTWGVGPLGGSGGAKIEFYSDKIGMKAFGSQKETLGWGLRGVPPPPGVSKRVKVWK